MVNLLRRGESATCAAKELNINNSLITACCKGRVKNLHMGMYGGIKIDMHHLAELAWNEFKDKLNLEL